MPVYPAPLHEKRGFIRQGEMPGVMQSFHRKPGMLHAHVKTGYTFYLRYSYMTQQNASSGKEGIF